MKSSKNNVQGQIFKNICYTIRNIQMYKTILVGDTNTGKSNLLFWILKGRKRDDNYPTVGIEVGTKSFEMEKTNTNVNIQFWDTAGQERFRSICLQHYKGARAALLLFDITNRESFNNLVGWIREVNQNVENEQVIICLLGNKLDRRQNRVVLRQEAEEFAKLNGLAFYVEISAETGENINLVLRLLFQNLMNIQPSQPKQGLSPQIVPPSQSGCGC